MPETSLPEPISKAMLSTIGFLVAGVQFDPNLYKRRNGIIDITVGGKSIKQINDLRSVDTQSQMCFKVTTPKGAEKFEHSILVQTALAIGAKCFLNNPKDNSDNEGIITYEEIFANVRIGTMDGLKKRIFLARQALSDAQFEMGDQTISMRDAIYNLLSSQSNRS